MTCHVKLQGRFGNQVMQYLFARAWCEKCGWELMIEPWVGEKVFDLPEHRRPDDKVRRDFNEEQLFEYINPWQNPDIAFRGYAQSQRCMIYTKTQAQAWLPFKQDVVDAIGGRDGHNADPAPFILAHRRAGDYFGYGYPVVSEKSYETACKEFCLDPFRLLFVTEEKPFEHPWFKGELAFVPDFFRMTRAPILLRGNSSFSWLAALLGNGLVLSPVIDGLEGGKEHDCRFVPGNWPRFCNLDFVSDLHVAP